MPLLNFNAQFVEPIRAGTKAHTIRGDRKIPIRPGDRLFLYCGARTKNCFKILDEPVICSKVESIQIGFGHALRFVLTVDGQQLDRGEWERLARADGFKDFDKMMEFWKGRLPFVGWIIHWSPPA